MNDPVISDMREAIRSKGFEMKTEKTSRILSNILKTPLLRIFLITSLFVSAIFPLYSVFYIIPSFSMRLTANTEDEAVRTASYLKHLIINEKTELTTDSLSNETISEIRKLKEDFRLEKIKIFSKQGEIIFSTAPEEIGEKNKNDYFYNIVAKGNVYTKVVRKDTKSLEGRIVTADVVETYVPVLSNGTFTGAFEIYYDITDRKKEMDNLLALIYSVMFAIALILLITVIFILFKASKNILERDRAEEALRKAHEDLEKKVKERTADLSETNKLLLAEIEERRVTEEALHQSEERHRALVETSTDTIISANEKMEIIQWNNAASKLFGYQKEDVMAKPVSIIVPEKYAKAHNDSFNRFLKTGSPEIIGKSVALEGQTKNGNIVPIELSISAYKREGSWIFTSIIRDITERKHIEEERLRSYQTQTVLNQLLQTSLKRITLDEMLRQSIDQIFSIPWVSLEAKGCIFLVEDGVLVMKAQKGLTEPIKKLCRRVEFGKCLCGQAALSGKIVFTNCIDKHHEIQYEGILPHGHYCVPVVSDGIISGVINLYLKEGHCRDKKEEEFLQAAANVLVQMIKSKQSEENLQHTLNNLRKAMGGTIRLLSSTVGIRDPYTGGHQIRVADLARSIATEMGLSSETIDGIRLGALIHDIGKIGVPAEILSKPGKISPIEFSLIKTHSEIGYDLVKAIEFPWPIAEMVRQHHEKMDGSGYPQGLSGEEICIEARILCVSDVVEAMASHRPYRPSLGIDMALEEIEKKKGIHFDPKAVEACLRLFKEKGYKLTSLGEGCRLNKKD